MNPNRPLLALALATGGLIAILPAATVTMPVDEVRPGMRGTGLTVFDGTKRSEFTAEIIGVLENSFGPRRNLVLARLDGGPLAGSGVIQGMSGSPVYIDGRLVGAVSYSLGSFPKETIAGITPIDEMLRDDTPGAARAARAAPELTLPLAADSLTRLLSTRLARPEPFAARPGDVGAVEVGVVLRVVVRAALARVDSCMSSFLRGKWGPRSIRLSTTPAGPSDRFSPPGSARQ